MSKLLVKPRPGDGSVVKVTPQSVGWSYVGFELYRLKAGQSVSSETGDSEVCLVLITGKAEVSGGGQDFGTIGELSLIHISEPTRPY